MNKLVIANNVNRTTIVVDAYNDSSNQGVAINGTYSGISLRSYLGGLIGEIDAALLYGGDVKIDWDIVIRFNSVLVSSFYNDLPVSGTATETNILKEALTAKLIRQVANNNTWTSSPVIFKFSANQGQYISQDYSWELQELNGTAIPTNDNNVLKGEIAFRYTVEHSVN